MWRLFWPQFVHVRVFHVAPVLASAGDSFHVAFLRAFLFSCGAFSGLRFSCRVDTRHSVFMWRFCQRSVFMWRLFWPRFVHVAPLRKQCFHDALLLTFRFHAAPVLASLCSCGACKRNTYFHVVLLLACLFSCGACSGLSGAPFSCGASAGALVFMWRLFWPQFVHVALLRAFLFPCGACSGLSLFMWRLCGATSY